MSIQLYKQCRCLGLAVLIGLLLLSCEQVINPTLQPASPILVVDAWLNNKPTVQSVILTETQPYFDDAQPAGVSGATVIVTDMTDGITTFSFVENSIAKGSYEWTPTSGSFGTIGHNYKLSITLNGETFEAASTMGRVPTIDSITFEKDERSTSSKPKFQGQFWAKDLAGKGDAYWIRAVKNDTLLNKPSEINIAYDAGFSKGGDTDGVEFLPPIRTGITPDNSDQSSSHSPYLPGDSVYVEISSITSSAFDFLNEVKIQTDRPGGFSELFAKPLSNVSTNMINTNPNGSAVMGFFNTAAVSSKGKRFK